LSICRRGPWPRCGLRRGLFSLSCTKCSSTESMQHQRRKQSDGNHLQRAGHPEFHLDPPGSVIQKFLCALNAQSRDTSLQTYLARPARPRCVLLYKARVNSNVLQDSTELLQFSNTYCVPLSDIASPTGRDGCFSRMLPRSIQVQQQMDLVVLIDVSQSAAAGVGDRRIESQNERWIRFRRMGGGAAGPTR
jgi:hypothetical protein